MKEETPLKQLIGKIRSVNNILVTVSRNPSVDQLTSTLGLSLALNKMNKRSVAVFSGQIPRAIHFLNPEQTFENNADSLRDFIISLSKDKADRLKVRPDGDFVKVYITPYRTKITVDDLKFEEGDFNIELIIAVGVASRNELDASIASHGKIFHNATTATLNLGQTHDGLGMISWQDSQASCYAEMCYQLVKRLSEGGKSLVDESIATAFLTGIVAATDQFRNAATSPTIMSLAADLMSHGANQQLITSELEAALEEPRPSTKSEPASGSQNNESEYDRNEPTPPPVSKVNSELIDQRLEQDRQKYGQERGQDALTAAQAELRQVTPPEAPRLDCVERPEPAPKPTPEPALQSQPEPESQPEPKPQPSFEPLLVPTAEPTVPPQPEPAPVPPAPAPQPTPEPVQPPVEPISQTRQPLPSLRPIPTTIPSPDSMGIPASMSGSYIMSDGNNSSMPTPPANYQPEPSDVPFNQPNQVSPIPPQPVQPTSMSQPNLSQPTLNPEPLPMPGSEPSLTQPVPSLNMPLPPVPPAPVSPDQLGSMPPQSFNPTEPTPAPAQSQPSLTSPMPAAPSAAPGFNPVPASPAPNLAGNVPPAPTNNQPTDPSQFVIPS